MKIVLGVLVGFFSLVNFAVGSDSEVSRGSLKGLNGVAVLVEDMDSDEGRAGLNQEVIRTDAELKLRLAGITVLPIAGLAPYLYISVNAIGGPTAWCYATKVELVQTVKLSRDMGISIPGVTTWSAPDAVGLTPPSQLVERVRSVIKDMVDRFINAYLSVNPKK
jgi:hypothetical protein